MAPTRAATFPVGNRSGGGPPFNTSITVQNVGDMVAVFASNGSGTITGISGGGVTTWTPVFANLTGAGQHVYMWWGIATSAGSQTITLTYGAGPTFYDVVVDSWTAVGESWSLTTSNNGTGSGTTVTWPSLSAVNSNSVYIGYEIDDAAGTTGTTTGFTWTTYATGSSITVNGTVTAAGSPYAPVGTIVSGPAGAAVLIGAIFTAGVPGGSIAATDIEYHASTLTVSSIPSLGGAIAATLTSGAANNLWDDVTSGESSAGDVEYRCFYVKNANASLTWLAAVIWIDGAPAEGSVAIALDSVAPGTSATARATCADENTAPTNTNPSGGVDPVFTSPTTKATGLAIGDVPATGYKAIWIRRTIPAAAPGGADAISVRAEGGTP